MQNIHAHAWDQALHLAPATVRESEISRGFPLDMTVDFAAFMADMAPFARVVVFGMKARLAGIWVPDDYVAAFVARAPEKLVGFASCDPTQPGYLDELRQGIESLGLVGVKMGPMYAGFDPRDARCDPVYAYCQEQGLPILFHSGTTFVRAAPLEFTRPWLFDAVAIRYPELRMVLAHVGHPFCEECLVVIRKHPHVYADVSALYYRPWQFYTMLVAAQEYGVTHKLLFGTDYPFAPGAESIEGLRRANHLVDGTNLPRISSETIEGVLERDAFGLLGIGRGIDMKITDVEAMVLDTGKNYPDPAGGGGGARRAVRVAAQDQHRRGHHRLVRHRNATARRQGDRRCAIRRRDRASSRSGRHCWGRTRSNGNDSGRRWSAPSPTTVGRAWGCRCARAPTSPSGTSPARRSVSRSGRCWAPSTATA